MVFIGENEVRKTCGDSSETLAQRPGLAARLCGIDLAVEPDLLSGWISSSSNPLISDNISFGSPDLIISLLILQTNQINPCKSDLIGI